jgi:hypothetical protein
VPVREPSTTPCGIVREGLLLRSNQKFQMDFDTFDTDLFQELNDMPGEIYDIEEEKFDVQEYINGNTDY